jgi:hypothetical protein
MVSTGASAPWKDTVVDHGVSPPPAGRQHDSPIGCSEVGWRTHAGPVAGFGEGERGVPAADHLPWRVRAGTELDQMQDRSDTRCSVLDRVADRDVCLGALDRA